jgi:hypothetical protein
MSYYFEKGVYLPKGGSLGTRDYCIGGRDFDPYLNHAFAPDTITPFKGQYAENLDRIVSLDTDMTFPYYSRVRKGCSDQNEYSTELTFDYLPYNWQQDDYRPIHFMEDTRLAVKDMCRSRPCAWDGEKYLQCAAENDSVYNQQDGCGSIESIFDDRPLIV